MEFQGEYRIDGVYFGKSQERLLNHCKHNLGKRCLLSDLLSESVVQRKFFEGAVIPMWVFLNGRDYKDSKVCKDQHEIAKLEFNPKIIISEGKDKTIGGSTKGKLEKEQICNKVIDYLEDQYGIDRSIVLNHKEYKHWKDTLRSFENVPFNYIDYLISIKKLSPRSIASN